MKANNDYNKSMIAFLKDCRANTGNRDIWSFYGKRKTRDDFYVEIDRVATFLQDKGLTNGKSIAICLPNIPDAIVATYAVNKVGAIANIIHPLIPSDGLKHIIDNIGSSALFIFDLFFEKHRKVIEELNIPTIVCSVADYTGNVLGGLLKVATHSKIKNIKYIGNIMKYTDIIKTEPRAIDDSSVTGEDIAVYLHSGGTTGSPKTVMLSNRALNACADKTRALIGGTVNADDCMLMVLPLFHGFGLGVCMHTVLAASGRVVLMAQFNAKQAIKLLKKEKISFIAGVPTMYDKMMDEPSFVGKHLMYLKHCYCGGDKLPEATKVRFDELLKKAGNPISLNEGYGLTEVVTVCAVNTEEESRFPSVGKGLQGVEFKIVDSDGNTLEIGKVGEICVSAETMMSGYFNDEETTRVTMRADENGKYWIHTGDIGYLDGDGYLYFKDRLKRMVKISGMNVFPKEIEEIVEKIPEIRFASAISSKLNGKQIIKLYVVMQKGYKFSSDIEDKIRNTIASELMKYSVPRIIECRDSLPLTQIGKVDYKQLQELEDKNI